MSAELAALPQRRRAAPVVRGRGAADPAARPSSSPCSPSCCSPSANMPCSAAASASRRRSMRRSRSRPSRPGCSPARPSSSGCSTGWSGGCTGRRADSPLFHFNFAFFVGGGAIAVLVAKYQALAFFSDAMSFQIIRNLGGGSLVDALLYALSDAGLMLIALAGAAALLSGRAVRPARRWRDAPALPDFYRFGWRKGAAGLRRAARCCCSRVNRVDDARVGGGAVQQRARASRPCSTRRPISTATAGASSPSRSTASRSTRAAIPMRSTFPATASTRTGFGGDFAFSGSAATAPPPRHRRRASATSS